MRLRFLILLVLITASFSISSQVLSDGVLELVQPFLTRYPSSLCSWNERGISVRQKMKDDGIIEINGSYLSLCSNNALQKSITFYDHLYYDVVWSNGEDTLWHIRFPNSIEFISGLNHNDLCLGLEQSVMSVRNFYNIDLEDSFIPINGDLFKSGHPLIYDAIPSLTTTAYFFRDSVGLYHPYDKDGDLEKLVCTMFRYPLSKDSKLLIKQSVGASDVISYCISLHQWLRYCQSMGMNIYTGIEERRSDSLLLLVLAECLPLGFNHLLSIEIPLQYHCGDDLVAKLYAYIPTYNLSKFVE